MTTSHGSNNAPATMARLLRAATAVCAMAAMLAGTADAAYGAQEPTDGAAGRPTIGLVLAGGGARGFSHIGVIKVLEEARIPVDYITGTSMGSIIGGLYASGMSPEEMNTVLRRIDWVTVLSEKPDRQSISFRRKEDDRLALFPFEIGIGPDGMSLKPGIFSGSKVEYAFRVFLLDLGELESFDDLRIPFRAIGTDLATGEAVVLDHGDLPRAMRASMAIPGVFTPVVIDGRTLIDGGLADNMPVGVAKDLGAQRIIAVDVGTPPHKDVSKLTAFGVVSQTIDILSENSVEAQRALLEEGDLLITPDLGDLGAAGFDRFDEAVAAGEAAARAALPRLLAFSVSEEEYAAFLLRQRRGTMVPEVRVDSVRVDVRKKNGTVETSRVLAGRIETTAGPIDPNRLADDLLRLTQAGEYETPTFRIEERAGARELVLLVNEKVHGPGFVRFGMGVESDLSGSSDFSATTLFRLTGINTLGAEWKSIVSVGNPYLLFTEFFQPLDRSGFVFVAPYLSYFREQAEAVIPGGDLEVIDRRIFEGGVDIGVQLRNWAQIEVGYLRGDARSGTETTSVVETDDSAIGAVRFHGTIDQVDNIFFPTRGNYTDLEIRISREKFGADDEFERLSLRSAQAWSWKRNTFVGTVRIGSDLGSDMPLYSQFELGGFLNLSGLPRGFLRGEVSLFVGLVDYWRLFDLKGLGNIYLGVSLETGGAWADADDVDRSDLINSGMVFFGVDTKNIPIYLGFGLAEGGQSAAYIFVGRAFF